MKQSYLAALGIVAAAAVYAVATRPKAAGAALAGTVASLADGFAGEVGNIAGEAVGVPRTSATQCEIDKAAGDTWAASFSCPAGEFLGWLWNR